MKKITITVNEHDLNVMLAYCSCGDNPKIWNNTLKRIRKAIAFAKINPGTVLDKALKKKR